MTNPPPVARPGDICILLEPSQAEIPHLRRLQFSLQEQFGGRPQERVHLTCQRMDAQNEDTVQRLKAKLRQELEGIERPRITATSVILLSHEFWQMTMLRWEIEKTSALHQFLGCLEAACTAVSVTPHYRNSSGWVPSTLTALEDVDVSAVKTDIENFPSPQYLYTGSHLTLSRIVATREFEILDSFPLELGV